ncbi:MAG: hypothetical protein SGI98_03680 [Verrucomicrobiota bacterium]|nr:hypothetical protein [Verrucomicrobiota bacterium]
MKKNLFITLIAVSALSSSIPSALSADETQNSKSTKASITFEQADTNKDGKITKSEADAVEDQNAPIVKFFWEIDKNEDSSLTKDEFNYWTKVEGNRYPGILLFKVMF